MRAEMIDPRTPNTFRRKPIFEKDGWMLYMWDEDTISKRFETYTIWHKCGIEMNHRALEHFSGDITCTRCLHVAPNEIVGLYQLCKWGDEGSDQVQQG